MILPQVGDWVQHDHNGKRVVSVVTAIRQQGKHHPRLIELDGIWHKRDIDILETRSPSSDVS